MEKKRFVIGHWHHEDHWFWLALILSILLHSLVFLSIKREPVVPQPSVASVANVIAVKFIPLSGQTTPTVTPASKPQVVKSVANSSPPKATKIQPIEKESLQSIPESPSLPQTHESTDEVNSRRKEDYLNVLLMHIESHKYYPQAAKRRGVTGQVHISFRLLANGEIIELLASDGPALLRHAAYETMQQASPLPLPPKEIDTPLQVSFTMQYQLQ